MNKGDSRKICLTGQHLCLLGFRLQKLQFIDSAAAQCYTLVQTKIKNHFSLIIPKPVNMNKTLMLLKQPDLTCKACLSSVAALACCDAFLSSFCSAVDFLREDFSDLYLSLSLACSSSCTTGDQYSLM